MRASAFQRLGYRTAVLRDADKRPSVNVEEAFVELGGAIFSWRHDHALEDELFLSLPHVAVGKMIDEAVDLHGDAVVDDHIKSAAMNRFDLRTVRAEIMSGALSVGTRTILGKAARTRKAGWFKSVSWMEAVAREIVAPQLRAADAGFREVIDRAFDWMRRG
jgi:putative ATP-dependent endonuclease of OLD family